MAKSKLFATIKILVSFLLVTAIIVYFIDPASLIVIIGRADISYILIPILAYVLLIFMLGWRWKLVLHFLSVKIQLRDCIVLYFKHNLINQVSPGSLVGDGYRIVHLVKKHKASKVDALSSVIFERMIGLSTRFMLLILFSFLFLRMVSIEQILLSAPSNTWFLVAATVFFAAIVGCVFAYPKVMRLLTNFTRFLSSPSLILQAVIITLAAQLLQIVSAFGIVLMLHVPISFFQLAITFIAVELLMMIPVSVNGWGTRELAIIYCFSLFGVEATIATAFSLLSRAVYTAVTLLGVPFFVDEFRKYFSFFISK